MADANCSEVGDLPAGRFSSWITGMQAALRGEHPSDVPCGGCTACCTSSQFIHIGPDETDTLAHIPAELLFTAPRLPRGHVVLGYDERGHCPMLVGDRCSIYEHRPRACRTYDCRIFPAAGLEIDDDDKVRIARRAQRWQFSYDTPADRNRHAAVRAAAAFVNEHADLVVDRTVPIDTTQHAVLAIEMHEAFLGHGAGNGDTTIVDPDPEFVRVELMRRTRTPFASAVDDG